MYYYFWECCVRAFFVSQGNNATIWKRITKQPDDCAKKMAWPCSKIVQIWRQEISKSVWDNAKEDLDAGLGDWELQGSLCSYHGMFECKSLSQSEESKLTWLNLLSSHLSQKEMKITSNGSHQQISFTLKEFHTLSRVITHLTFLT